jgi:hypothetical protein
MANLETITGSLENALAKADRRTIQHAWEITNDRRTQTELREQWFWTADFPMYRLEDGEAVLYFAAGEYNLVFANIGDAAPQIKATGNYMPSKKDEARVVRSGRGGKTLRIPLSDLALQEENAERCFFEIDTAGYAALNPAQRALAERIYGKGEDFRLNMKVLREEGRIAATKIYVLNPKYIREHARTGAIGRVSWLDDFYDGLLFIVLDRDISSANGFLRAVPLEPEARRGEDESLAAAFAVVMARVEAWTPEIYAAFSRAITDRLAKMKR